MNVALLEGSEYEQATKAQPQALLPFYLQGRNRTGSDARGKLYHALPAGSDCTFRKALCGKAPGRQSGGWAEPCTEAEVTCPACLRKLNV